MRSLLFVSALALLTSACVSHDQEEIYVEESQDLVWEQTAPQTQTEPMEMQTPHEMVIENEFVDYDVIPQEQPMQTQPVIVEQPAAPQPATQKTWWQENRKKHVVKVVTPACPCEDPNDPCTHCYQK